MAKTKKQKKQMVDDYKKKIENSKALIVLAAKGVTPNEASEFKKNLFELGSEYHTVKNRLLKIALKELNFEDNDSIQSGEHSVVFVTEEVVGSSKVIKKFVDEVKTAEGDQKASMLFGFLEQEFLSKDQVQELAEMPDKQGSVALILGILDQALSGVVNVLEDAPRAYVSVIDQAFKE